MVSFRFSESPCLKRPRQRVIEERARHSPQGSARMYMGACVCTYMSMHIGIVFFGTITENKFMGLKAYLSGRMISINRGLVFGNLCTFKYIEHKMTFMASIGFK